MANYVIVNNATGLVENSISMEPGFNYPVPEGFSIYERGENVGIGWKYENGQWIEPSPPEETQELETL